MKGSVSLLWWARIILAPSNVPFPGSPSRCPFPDSSWIRFQRVQRPIWRIKTKVANKMTKPVWTKRIQSVVLVWNSNSKVPVPDVSLLLITTINTVCCSECGPELLHRETPVTLFLKFEKTHADCPHPTVPSRLSPPDCPHPTVPVPGRRRTSPPPRWDTTNPPLVRSGQIDRI